MRYKLLLFLILVSLITTQNKIIIPAQITGEAVSTDIAAFIDNQPIKSYNIEDSTYIVAEDLRGYGFDVIWNESERSLKLYRNTNTEHTMLNKEDINIKRSDLKLGQKLFDVYASDITVYLEDEIISSCSANGVMLVKLRDFEKCGYVAFNDEYKQAKLDIILKTYDNAYDLADKQELSIDDHTSYIGEVKDGKPNGIGKIYTNSTGQVYYNPSDISEGFVKEAKDSTMCQVIDFGYFKDGLKDGIIYSSGRRIGVDEQSGYQTVIFDIESYGCYMAGQENGLFYTTALSRDSNRNSMRTDYFAKQGKKNGKHFKSILNSNYLYGYYVDSLLEYDMGVRLYTKIDPGVKFKKVNYGEGLATAISEDNKLYLWWGGGQIGNTAGKAPVFIRNNVAQAALGSTGGGGRFNSLFILTTDNKLYKSTDLIDESKDTLLLENVKCANMYNYLDTNGDFYYFSYNNKGVKMMDNVKSFDGDYSPLILKNDNSAWTLLKGVSWSNGVDISTPVKIADNCLDVDECEGRAVLVKEDKTVWGYYLLYGGNYIPYFIGCKTVAPIKIAEGFVQAECGYDFVAAKKEDNSLWVWGDNKKHELGRDGDGTLTPEKLLEDVVDFSCFADGGIAIKSDGTLWAWGDNVLSWGLFDSEIINKNDPSPRQLFAHELIEN